MTPTSTVLTTARTLEVPGECLHDEVRGEGPLVLLAGAPQEVADERHFFLHQMRATTHWQPDTAALRSATTRIVVGIGEQSRGQTCDRTATALAAALGIEPTMFPGGDTGFATRLRAVPREG